MLVVLGECESVLVGLASLIDFPPESRSAGLSDIKQIMTGLEGNRQIYLPREIQDRLPKSFYWPRRSRGQ